MFEPNESAINEPNFPSESGFYALIYKDMTAESCNNFLFNQFYLVLGSGRLKMILKFRQWYWIRYI